MYAYLTYRRTNRSSCMFIKYIIFPMTRIKIHILNVKRTSYIINSCNRILIYNVMNISQIIKYCSYIMIFNSRIAFQNIHGSVIY